jgi:hypothetical protein
MFPFICPKKIEFFQIDPNPITPGLLRLFRIDCLLCNAAETIGLFFCFKNCFSKLKQEKATTPFKSSQTDDCGQELHLDQQGCVWS